MITSTAEYMALLESDDASVRGRVINEPVAGDVLLRLICEQPDLKSVVIRNKAIPESILVSLIDDEDADIRWAVAKKRKLPMPYLEKLAYDPAEHVRREVAHHGKITKHILEILAKDEEVDIAEKARQRLVARDYRD